MMPRRIKLNCQFFHNGHLYQPGEIVTLADGEDGPQRAVHNSVLKIDYDPANGIDANRTEGGITDVPLYEDVKED
jgi:hypothetical protein